MKGISCLAAALTVVLACASHGKTNVPLPWDHEITSREIRNSSSHALPTGPFAEGKVPFIAADGDVETLAVRLATKATTLEIMQSMKRWLLSAGFAEIYSCHDRMCGGFRFRSRIDVVHSPDMFLDLADFRFLSARRSDGSAFLQILVSRSSGDGYLQVTSIEKGGASRGIGLESRAVEAAPSAETPVARQLLSEGYHVLEELTFATGSHELGEGEYPVLEDLASFLGQNPTTSIFLVGHTDTQGTLASNIALSRKRAESVLVRLVENHGIARERLGAEGIGFLAPRTTNRTPEGMATNRRVVAVLVRE